MAGLGHSCALHPAWILASGAPRRTLSGPLAQLLVVMPGSSCPGAPACSEIKERAKKVKADKQQQKLQAKAAGGKAVKNVPKGAGKAGAKSTGR